MIEIKNNKLIVVLGMHRSGTSVITRALEVMGVQLGDRLLPTMKDVNAKGFWEDLDLNALDEEMLDALNVNWHHLAPIDVGDVEVLRQKGYFLRAVELLRQKVGNVPNFGFKDPRVAKLLPFWKEVFRHCQFDVSYVVVIRHPLSVAKSLAKRNGFDAEKSYLLWLGHVITSISDTAGDKRVLVDYDCLMQLPERELSRVAKGLDLVIDPTKLQSYQSEFLDQKLRHTVYNLNDLLLQDSCPPLARDIYTVLKDVAVDKISIDDPVLQGQINQWVSEFERFNSLLTLADRLYSQKAAAIAERDEKIGAYHQTVLGRDEYIASLNQVLTERNEYIASLNQVVIERDEQISNLNQAVAERDNLISQFFSSISWRLTRPLRAVKPFFTKMFFGKAQGHPQTPDSFPSTFVPECVDWTLMLPAIAAAKSEQWVVPQSVVDVIIPVYRGLEQTRRCINSVLDLTTTTPFRLIVINDASPEVEVTEYLRSLFSSHQIIVVENADNLGFTATVNRGMMWSDSNDVVLLNSDTEVANDWLDKLKIHAYSGSQVGTVTPFSNNATICSYPTIEGLKNLPVGETTKSLDAAFASANKGRNIEIPTAVGFCMYIRRDCLNEVGLFDVETFGKGYGEENDFCLRAAVRGWKHLLAADTFVFHEGEVSFTGESNPRKEAASSIIRKLYPNYEAAVSEHIGLNQAYPLRVAATAARFKQSEVPVVLHILHSHGGGTEKHVEELCHTHYGKAKLLIMTPPFVEAGKAALQIRSADPLDALDIHLPTSNVEFLVSLLHSFSVKLVHIHHVLGYPFDLHSLVEKMGVPFYLTVHDYFLICPRINLMPIGERYCGEPELSKCNHCLSVDYPLGAGDILWWRESHAWLFNDASVVICPSHDVATRCQRYFPNSVYRVVAHEKALSDVCFDIDISVLNKKEPLRVAILGVLARHKGIELIAETLLVAEKNEAPLQFQLIGYAESDLPSVSSTLFSQTGHYVDAELVDKIHAFNPHLILFSSVCPETYSYTLTTAMKSKRPIMALNLGAFPERLAFRPWTWLIDWNISATQLVDRLCEVRITNFYTRTAPITTQKNGLAKSFAIEDSGFYENGYLSVGNNIGVKGIVDIRTAGKITALVLIENIGPQPGPCAYIRLILPLIRERGEKFDLRWVTPEQVIGYVADVLICQRTAVTSITVIDTISAHCRENNIRIVYDLDDLLLTLPEDHPEYEIYAPKSAAVFRWLLEADEVWVSTEALRHHVCQVNPRTHVVPNYIDDKLWIKPKMSVVKHEWMDSVRLLYMGTQTHRADFELVKKVLKRLKDEFLERIEINLIGISPDISSEKWYETITPPQAIGISYPAFVNWICNEPTFDIGIAPLVDNEFNRCKSAIKFLDYSALGLATVASDLNGYLLIRNGENGFRVKNTEESWYEVLKILITDSALRNQIQLTAQKDIFEKYDYKSVAGHRTNLLTSLLSENAKIENT
ncbi:MAG: glycosyltransferase [Deltaproteobacteria bacterium]|nr:glycosyltransferase [Deltaproteobacteria bacterium]